MAYQKQTFKDNETVLKAEHLNHIEDGIVALENTMNDSNGVLIPSVPYLLLNLTKYGISNDGKNAEATTNGINQAIADAVANGYSTIVFPKGEYLISGDGQINITGRLTVDFNNSVLRKEANANDSYVMVEISGDHNVVKNATLYGDRETHDFSSGGTHEWGIGIDITADSRFTVIENVDIFDTTGYGINTSVMHNQIEPIRNRPLEAGCYDTSTGELVESTTHTILGYTLDITDSAIKNDMFILGGNGYGAHGIKEPLTFYMSFYDENETYIGFSRAYRLYDNIDLKSLLYWYPSLRYIKFSIENTDTETNVTLELRSSYTSDDITIKNCEIARCRTLGIAITGGKRIEVENVSIHDIGGAAPGYGVDIEDGYQLNQYIVFRSCEFYNNKYGDIVVVKARDILVENCRFQGFQRSLNLAAEAAAIGMGAEAESVTSKFEVRSSVFTDTAVKGENIVFYNCVLLKCNPISGNFTECRFYCGIIQSLYGTTLKSCYLKGVRIAQRGGNFGFYNSTFESGCSFEEQNLTDGDTSEWWVMDGCTINDATVTPRSSAPYIRITNNKFYRNSENFKCVFLNTLQKTYLHITGNTFEQAGRIGLVHLKDTYGSEVVMEGNVFKSTGASDIGPYQPRAYIICTGLVTVSDNIFDTAYLSAAYGVMHLENCAKTIVANNKFLGGYVLPIKMVSVTETLCDGNDYTGTPVLADTRTGVDIPDACGKSYVDGLIGDVNTVIASINTLVGGA